MKKLLILRAGTAGTLMANHLRPKLDANDWSITIVDQESMVPGLTESRTTNR